MKKCSLLLLIIGQVFLPISGFSFNPFESFFSGEWFKSTRQSFDTHVQSIYEPVSMPRYTIIGSILMTTGFAGFFGYKYYSLSQKYARTTEERKNLRKAAKELRRQNQALVQSNKGLIQSMNIIHSVSQSQITTSQQVTALSQSNMLIQDRLRVVENGSINDHVLNNRIQVALKAAFKTQFSGFLPPSQKTSGIMQLPIISEDRSSLNRSASSSSARNTEHSSPFDK